MRPSGAVPLLLFVLLVGGAAGQSSPGGWTHAAGGADHASVAHLGERPLDVVATYRLETTEGERIWSLLWTPHGPTGLGRIEVAPTWICQLFRITDVDAGVVQRFGSTVACPDGARLLAYDAVRDLLLVEFDGPASSPILQAWEATTGEKRWEVGPNVTFEPSGGQDNADWAVADAALDEATGIVYVGFTLEVVGRHRIQAVSMEDGATLWSTSIPVATGLVQPLGLPPETQPLAEGETAGQAQNLMVHAITLTEDGIVLRGSMLGGLPVYAWLSREGRVVGTTEYAPQPEPEATATAYSYHAASLGPLAAFVLDDDLVLVDPVNRQPTRVPLPSHEALWPSLAAPAWSREALVVPLVTTAVVYPAGDTASARVWPGYDGSWIASALVAPPSDAYALVQRATLDGNVADLLRIDLASARTIDRLPIPLPHEDVWQGLMMLPLGEGRMLVWSFAGGAVLLAEAPEELRPQIVLDNEYPAAGEALTLLARAPIALSELTVAWGDGVLDRAQPDTQVAHAYESPGRRVVRVIALYPDNRTGTAEAIVYVGASPPQQLTAIQQAFAPENQEITFFALGLAATGIGGLLAYGRTRRRKSRLQTDMEALDALRAQSHRDPFAAVQQLAMYRTRIKKDLAAGALDDAQFTALSSEAVRLLGALRLRLLGSLRGRLSPRFRHMLEAALEDGQVASEEATALREALDAEAELPPQERARLAALIESWQAADAPPPSA